MSSYLLMVPFYHHSPAAQYPCEDLKDPDTLQGMTEIRNTTAGNVFDPRVILLEHIFTHAGNYFVSPDAPILYGDTESDVAGIRRTIMGDLKVEADHHLLDSIQDREPSEGDFIIDTLSVY